MLDPNDERHGTTRGFHQGCRERCCRDALNAYERRRRSIIAIHGSYGAYVDPTGTRRRIEALLALGWFAEEIAAECGWKYRNDVLQFRGHKKIRVNKAETIEEVYERLSMKIPPPALMRRRTRNHAARKGWAPPLAWDNIDDPHERPKGVAA